VLRSDCYRLDDDAVLHQESRALPFVDLSGEYKLVSGFEQRFPDGVPSLKDATSLRVEGDWSFGADVKVQGDVTIEGEHGRIDPGTVLSGDSTGS
jgi:UTP--glucose-1-phosphate uridylyltransferase